MEVSKEELARAAAAAGVTAEQAETLWKQLADQHPTRARFDAAHVAYYFGALLVIVAMGWFMTEAIEKFPGVAIAAVALAYAVAFIVAGFALWRKKDLRIPGGLLYTMAVCMTPLIVYGMEKAMETWAEPTYHRYFFHEVNVNSVTMELCTILAGVLMLFQVRFPFLCTPVLVAAWCFTMDAAPLVVGRDLDWSEEKCVAVGFGVILLIVSYLIDRRTREDFAFWGYLFGLASFWGGMTAMDGGSELSKFFYALINVGLIVLSVPLQRRAFLIFGALGVLLYLGHVSYWLFKDSLIFPLALSALGLAVLFLGVLYAKKGAAWEAALLAALPERLRQNLPSQRTPPV